jgi:micrococcal nuclease|tara:strand:- start:89 stop:433 length:345 start_codon:yes stop_codon:yes gene_type:complete
MYQYKAKLIRVVDGDTVDAEIDLGFDVWVKKRIRLADINAWESRTRDKEVKAKGLRAKEWLQGELLNHDNEFVVVSTEVGKYGRCLGHIFVGDDLDYSVNLRLIDEGHAVPYEN